MLLPRIAITLGDPAGVGPETIVGAWSDPVVHASCRPLVVGHPDVVRRAVRLLGSEILVEEVDAPEQARPEPHKIPCLRSGGSDAMEVAPGVVDARGGQAAYDALLVAAHLALLGQVDAITTAPLHKAALWRAGHRYPGHTELLAELCGVNDFAMMLYLGTGQGVRGAAGLSIVHVTLHMSLADALASLDEEGILRKIRLVTGVVSELKGSQPRVGVCALNPHAGEEGLFGDEELTIVLPAVERAKAEGSDVVGPLPADTLIARAAAGEFDGVVAMYHDQGHIAVKLLAMHRAVNVTLGLPIVRTSVAHGTAFDLAWQGRAETTGMVEALRVAARLSAGRLATST
jgi:4-hydroxythreonine-4-phosphate dehydrogenase